jgi:hypothetical protein
VDRLNERQTACGRVAPWHPYSVYSVYSVAPYNSTL